MDKPMDPFLGALETRFGSAYVKAVQGASVAICGLGGLGSHVALALVRSGLGTLYLYDDDQVDCANLNRQQYFYDQIGEDKTQALAANLLRIYPQQRLVSKKVHLTPANAGPYLAPATVVVEAFDRPEEKAWLANEVLLHYPDKILVTTSGIAGFGPLDSLQTRKISARWYLVGDLVSGVDFSGRDLSRQLPATKAMAAGAAVAHVIVSSFLGEELT